MNEIFYDSDENLLNKNNRKCKNIKLNNGMMLIKRISRKGI